MESFEEYRIVCDCHGPLQSGLSEAQAKERVRMYQLDFAPDNHARIEKRIVSSTPWEPVNG